MKKKKTLCKPHQKAWQRKSSSNAQMVIMFLSFAESCDPLNSFNWWGGGAVVQFHLKCLPSWFLQVTYYVLRKNTRRIMRFCFFFLFQYCHFGRLSPWHMFSWLGGSVSHFHRFLMGWEILGRKTARRLPRSPRRDWIIRNIFLHLTFELQGSTHSFCSASSSFFFYTPTCQLHLFRLRFKSRQRSETR